MLPNHGSFLVGYLIPVHRPTSPAEAGQKKQRVRHTLSHTCNHAHQHYNTMSCGSSLKSSLWVTSHVKRLGEFRRFPQLASKLADKFDVVVIGTLTHCQRHAEVKG